MTYKWTRKFCDLIPLKKDSSDMANSLPFLIGIEKIIFCVPIVSSYHYERQLLHFMDNFSSIKYHMN